MGRIYGASPGWLARELAITCILCTGYMAKGSLSPTGSLGAWPALIPLYIARDANRRTRVHHFFNVTRQ